jgi:thioredoxin
MISKRIVLAAALVIATVAATGVTVAGETKSYTQAAFAAAQAAGKPILVDITASWCPICKAQAPIIQRLSQQPEYRNLVILEVNFDTQKDVVRSFGARMQSTLVAYKGRSETGRSVGSTNADAIGALLQKTL